MHITRAISGFFAELQRRRVLHIGGVYIAGAWLGAEILTFLLEQAMAPGWTFRLVAIVFVVGFPVAVVLGWVVQVQADGSWAIDPSGGQRRTIIAAVALGLLATAGLSWLILPGARDLPTVPVYQPIPNSVAILPMVESGSAPHERTVAATLYTALLEGLNQSRELTLMRLRLNEPPDNLAEFGKSVKVAVLLAGSVVNDPAGTRVELSLLDVETDEVQWSQTFEWDPTRIMDTGTAIANGVLKTMSLPVLSQEKFTGTDNADAYDAFLQGEQRAESYNIDKLLMAMDDFQRAIDLDPGYVLAYVGLAETIGWYLKFKAPDEAEMQALKDRSRQALETALALDDESAEAISALGTITDSKLFAVQAFEHALELDPNHAKSYHRLAIERADRPEEVERLIRKALDLDPLNADWHNDLGGLLWNQQREEEALAEVRRSIQLDPELVWNHYKIGFWQAFDLGNLDEAMIHFRAAHALDPKNINPVMHIAGIYIDLGAREEAYAWVERLMELGPGSPWSWLHAWGLHDAFGTEQEARKSLERALELDPKYLLAVQLLGIQDVEAGHEELALERWQHAFPVLTTDQNLEYCVKEMFFEVLVYAGFLKQTGKTEQAQRIALACFDAFETWKEENHPRASIANEMEPLIFATIGQKEKTLDAMRRAIIDTHQRGATWYWLPVYDFIRDEPEFRELMEIIRSDLAEQLQRVREMECNGELAPAPDVVVKGACPAGS